MGTKFFTDSCWDMPRAYAQERDIGIVPLTFKIAEHEGASPEETSLPLHEFYELMRGGHTASTAQLNPFTCAELFRPVLQNGDDVFYLAFSSGLSSTYSNALVARAQLLAEFPERKIWIVDTLQASMGQGLVVHYALNMRDQGKAPDEIADWLKENLQHFCAWFTVLDLANLRRGGRVSAAAAFFGTMLNIKPVLHVDAEGHLVPVEKVKGRQRALRALADHLEKTSVGPNQPVFISHADNLTDANAVADMLRERFGIRDITIHTIGPVIGAHAGPDTIALFFFGENRD